jgi:hypothetical protein
MSLKDIAEHLKTIVSDNERTIVCTVKEVNNTLCVCEPIDQDLPDIANVRLCAEEEDAVILPVPKIGSQVIVVDTLDGGGYIAMFGELQSIYLRGDQYGGLIKIEKLVERINAIENKISGIIQGFNLHTHTETGGATSTPISVLNDNLGTTNRSDLENTNVKHG